MQTPRRERRSKRREAAQAVGQGYASEKAFLALTTSNQEPTLSVCHSPTLSGYETMSVCDFLKIIGGGMCEAARAKGQGYASEKAGFGANHFQSGPRPTGILNHSVCDKMPPLF